MNVEDTKATLNKGVSVFGNKFALIDFGTNCQTSNTDFLNVYYPFTNYMLASQFNYGGFSMDEWDYSVFEKNNIPPSNKNSNNKKKKKEERNKRNEVY